MKIIVLESVVNGKWERQWSGTPTEFLADNEDLDALHKGQVAMIRKGDVLDWNMGAGGVWRLRCLDDTVETRMLVFDRTREIVKMAFRATGDPTGCRFSRACSAMLRIARDEAAMHDDVRVFRAPSECSAAVRRWAEREAVNELARCGYADPVEFVVEYHSRMDGKQAYELALDTVLPRHVQWEGWDRFIGGNVSAIC